MLHFQDDKLGRVSTAASHLPRPQNAFRLPAFPLLTITVTHNAFLQDQECLPVRTDRHLQVNAALQRWRQKLQSCYELKKKKLQKCAWRLKMQCPNQNAVWGLWAYLLSEVADEAKYHTYTYTYNKQGHLYFIHNWTLIKSQLFIGIYQAKRSF